MPATRRGSTYIYCTGAVEFHRAARVGVTCLVCVNKGKEGGVSENRRLPGRVVLATPSARVVDITIRPHPPRSQDNKPSNTRARAPPRKLDVIKATPFLALQSANQPPSTGQAMRVRARGGRRGRGGDACAHTIHAVGMPATRRGSTYIYRAGAVQFESAAEV